MLPLVPVTVSVYVEADDDEHDTVDVPFVVRLVEERDPQFSPEVALSVNATVPVNP
jgi:hypothetical protein